MTERHDDGLIDRAKDAIGLDDGTDTEDRAGGWAGVPDALGTDVGGRAADSLSGTPEADEASEVDADEIRRRTEPL